METHVFNTTSPATITGNSSESATDCSVLGGYVINTLVGGTLCILGMLGNSLCFLVLRKDQDTPIVSFLLQTLACVDNVFLGLWLLHFSMRDFFTYLNVNGGLHVIWMYVVLYSYPLLFVAQSATIWLTVLIAVYRYLAVCKPYTARLNMDLALTKKGVLAVILFAVVYNLPRYFDSTIVERDTVEAAAVAGSNVTALTISHGVTNGTSTTLTLEQQILLAQQQRERSYASSEYMFVRTAFGSSKWYSLIYFDILYYVFSLFLPLLLLALLNIRLTVAYRALQRRRRLRWQQRGGCGCSGDDAQMSEQNITRVLILIVLAFMLCNAPARVVQIVWKYAPQLCPSVPFILMEVSNVLEVLLSSMNFVIYCVFRKQFRYILRHRLCVSDDEIRVARSRAVSLAIDNGMATAVELSSLHRLGAATPLKIQCYQNGNGISISGRTSLVCNNDLLLKVGVAHSIRCNSF